MQFEILAPAGNIQYLSEILEAKPDAVYVGLKSFSSRPQYADMDLNDIEEAVRLCHENGVRLYVAVNANVHESKVEELISAILAMDKFCADAVILSEFGLIEQLCGKLVHMKIHSSTLMGVYNISTVRLLKEMGVSRIIFYANLYFDEIASIINAVPDMEYELVAEGGTCFNDIRQCHLPHSYQGQQHNLFCRFNYKLQCEGREDVLANPISEHPTSTAEIIGLFMAIGIHSFKIEGRTVPAGERIPMIMKLRESIQNYGEGSPLRSYLHYFSRSNREMR